MQLFKNAVMHGKRNRLALQFGAMSLLLKPCCKYSSADDLLDIATDADFFVNYTARTDDWPTTIKYSTTYQPVTDQPSHPGTCT